MAATVRPSVNAAFVISPVTCVHSFRACSSALCLYVLEDWNKHSIGGQLELYAAESTTGCSVLSKRIH